MRAMFGCLLAILAGSSALADVRTPTAKPSLQNAALPEPQCSPGTAPVADAYAVAAASGAAVIIGGQDAADLAAALSHVIGKPVPRPTSLMVMSREGGGQTWVFVVGACSPLVASVPPPVLEALTKYWGLRV
jgi:hypothetical protein